jgi:hypothetical protein
MKTSSLICVRNVLLFSLVAEGATGLAVALAPGLVAQLIFCSDVAGTGVVFGRLLGVSLLALAIACWPSTDVVPRQVVHAVLAYNLLATVYIGYLGIAQHYAGNLLWPAVVEHALATLLLATRVHSARPATTVRQP